MAWLPAGAGLLVVLPVDPLVLACYRLLIPRYLLLLQPCRNRIQKVYRRNQGTQRLLVADEVFRYVHEVELSVAVWYRGAVFPNVVFPNVRKVDPSVAWRTVRRL